MQLEFHWTQYERCRQAGLEALEAGDRTRARERLLRAADHLFRVAKLSPPDLRRKRVAKAEELVELTRRLGSSAEGVVRPERESEGSEGGSFRAVERPDFGFDRVAGLNDVKEELRLRIVYPFLHRDSAARFGIVPGGGVLLYGPPGTGKTLIARAVAGEAECAFFTVKPSEILSKWVGEAEKNLAELFRVARREAPSIIFVDEIDALAPSRSETSSPVMARLVPQILTELEGFGGRSEPVLFLGATNEPWSLDPALLRPGRFDRQIHLGLPDLEARRHIIDLNLAGRPVDPRLDRDALARAWTGYTGADLRQICRRAADCAFLESIERGGSPIIDRARLERAAAETPRSVTEKRLEAFESYAGARTQGSTP